MPNPTSHFAMSCLRRKNMSETERIFAHAGANAEDISVAVSRAKGLPYDGNKRTKGDVPFLSIRVQKGTYLFCQKSVVKYPKEEKRMN